ncbi:MAG: sulfotransferase family protein [Bacteroidales bacterium]|nr:sulfotransferase family protein [Bacteroidales bacterium]
MIISLHIPKTAGTSFRIALQEHFGDSLIEDYGTRPFRVNYDVARKKAEEFNRKIKGEKYSNVKCIHGHFLAVKYANLKNLDATFITWLRDPVERLISNYYHIIRGRKDVKGTFSNLVHTENWDLETYCLHPMNKNPYEKIFRDFGIENFGFVGITENFLNDLNFFSEKYLNKSLSIYNENKRPIDQKLTVEDNFRKKIEEFHSIDVEIYRQALSKSNSR